MRFRALCAALLVLVAMVCAVPAHAAAATFTNPLNSTGPDPYMTYYNGNYYLMTTPWNGPLTMRKAPTIAALKQAAPVPVFNDFPPGRCCWVWAPEFHLINGHWYIYYSAGTGDIEDQRVHVAESAGLDPTGPYTYKGVVFGGWGIDGSVVTISGQLYYIWSGVPTQLWRDSDPHLYIAAMSNPWTVSGQRTAISAPTLSWETQGTPMNEGPVALQHGGRTFIVYSASACQGPDYKLGLLSFTGGNPLAASAWTKAPQPVFQRSDAGGVYGPGHNGFFTSPDGTESWIVYHANTSASQGCGSTRTTRIQKFTWHADGTPNLGVPVPAGATLTVPSGEPVVTYQRITNRGSGKVVDVQVPNAEDNARVGQWAWHGGPWQQWRFVDAGGGYVRIESLNSGKCLDVTGRSTADGALLEQRTCGTGNAFLWSRT